MFSGNTSLIIFSISMAWAIALLIIATRKKKKLWRPKDPKSVVIIKITLWSGLLTWMVFSLATSFFMARLAGLEIARVVSGTKGVVYSWVVPIWIIFTTLMLIWAVARFANKKLRGGLVTGKILKVGASKHTLKTK